MAALPAVLWQEVMAWLHETEVIRYRTLCKVWYTAMLTFQCYRQAPSDTVCPYAEHQGRQNLLTIANIGRVSQWTEDHKWEQLRLFALRKVAHQTPYILDTIVQSFTVPYNDDLRRELVLMGTRLKYSRNGRWPYTQIPERWLDIVDAFQNSRAELVETVLARLAGDDLMDDVCTGLSLRSATSPVGLVGVHDMARKMHRVTYNMGAWVRRLTTYGLEAVICQTIRNMWTYIQPKIASSEWISTPAALHPLLLRRKSWIADMMGNMYRYRLISKFSSLETILSAIVRQLQNYSRDTYGGHCFQVFDQALYLWDNH